MPWKHWAKSSIIASTQPGWFSDNPEIDPLQAHTIHAAYQAHLEDITGSIEVGKSAELVVLDSDIEACPVTEIQDIKVLETIFRGVSVFKR